MYRRSLLLSTDARQIFSDDLLQEVPPETWLGIAEKHVRAAGVATDLNKMLYLDVKITLADNDLRKVVGTAELAGTRVRFPLLDHQLGEFTGRIPTELKMKGWEKRYIFKQAMRGILPDKVLYKKKHGFGVPIATWFLSDPKLNAMMKDVLCDSRTRQRGYFRPEFLKTLMEVHNGKHAGYYGEYIWYLLVIELWHRQHLEQQRAALV
jgi:asparagine synthase (glutamine-hydrolysing)